MGLLDMLTKTNGLLERHLDVCQISSRYTEGSLTYLAFLAIRDPAKNLTDVDDNLLIGILYSVSHQPDI
jgi:hypothetical protein